MPGDKPVVYILRGDDREAIEKHLRAFRESLGQPDIAALNTAHLPGSSELNDLRSAALSVPFLAERRLVILEDALKPYEGSGKQKPRKEFLDLLESLPSTTGLVLIIADRMKYFRKTRTRDWETLNDRHWLIKWTRTTAQRTWIENCALPSGDEMVVWIKAKAVELGGEIKPIAAAKLADYVGNHTQQAAREIEKLLTYVNFERPVDDDDVERLSIEVRQRDIFTLVDAIGNRDGEKALEMFHLLLEELDFTYDIFPMIIRQFRLILQAREIIDGGGSDRDVAAQLHIHPFIANKVFTQSGKFDLQALESIYQWLLEIDVGQKTGGMPGEIAVDLLITRLTHSMV